jgi:hypothetical protein
MTNKIILYDFSYYRSSIKLSHFDVQYLVEEEREQMEGGYESGIQTFMIDINIFMHAHSVNAWK